MRDNDNRELVKRCIERDPEAWNEFVDRFSGLIYWAIKRKLNKYGRAYLISEAEEIYQRIFASIWEKNSLSSVRERNDIAPWLIVLASNATIDFIRKKVFEEDFLRKTSETQTISQGGEADILPEETRRLLDEAISKLNKKEKAYLESSYITGNKYKEIAEIFNTSINSVATVIFRAKNKVKKYIKSRDFEIK